MKTFRELLLSFLGASSLLLIVEGLLLILSTQASGGPDALQLTWLRGALYLGSGTITAAIILANWR